MAFLDCRCLAPLSGMAFRSNSRPDVVLLQCNILLHPSQARINGFDIEIVVAYLALAIEQHRNLVPPLFLKVRMLVHVDHLDLEVIAALELLQARYELMAQVAVLARQDSESWPQ